MREVEAQRTEDRGQRTEDRGQRTEDRGQRTEDRGQRTEDRGQRTGPRRASPPPEGRRSDAIASGWGVSRGAIEAPQVTHGRHPTPDRLRRSDPPSSGEGDQRK